MKTPHLHYEVLGNEGPYLLLVHGLLSSRAQWIPNVDALCEFCRPVIVELYGHGRSPSPADPKYYAPDSYVREFECIRENLGSDRWLVCGQSLGASLSLRYGLKHPDRIAAQAFTNSRSALSDESHDGFMDLLRRRLAADGRSFIDSLPLHPSQSKRLPTDIKSAMVRDAALVSVEGFANTMFYTVTQSYLGDLLRDTRIPTLMIVGRHDRRFAPILRDIAAQLIPDLQIRNFDGGHAVNIDAAEEFNGAIRDLVLQSEQP